MREWLMRLVAGRRKCWVHPSIEDAFIAIDFEHVSPLGTTAAIVLASRLHESGGDKIVLELDGVARGDAPPADYRVTVERADA